MNKFIEKILLESQVVLHESVINLLPKDIFLKKKYASEVYAIIQNSYSTLGGIKGTGFASPEDMINTIPFWKIVKRGDEITAVVMYKSKSGRKRVAGGTNGTSQGKLDYKMISREELKTSRSWGEVSGAPLAIAIKQHPDLEKFAIPVSIVKKLMPDDEIKQPEENDELVQKYPQLKNFFYQRNINGHWHTKVCLGKAYQTIGQ